MPQCHIVVGAGHEVLRYARARRQQTCRCHFHLHHLLPLRRGHRHIGQHHESQRAAGLLQSRQLRLIAFEAARHAEYAGGRRAIRCTVASQCRPSTAGRHFRRKRAQICFSGADFIRPRLYHDFKFPPHITTRAIITQNAFRCYTHFAAIACHDVDRLSLPQLRYALYVRDSLHKFAMPNFSSSRHALRL